MSLSERDRKLLAEMERELKEDRAFVSRISGRPSARLLMGAALLAIVGVLTLLAAVSMNVVFLGPVGYLMMLGAGVLGYKYLKARK